VPKLNKQKINIKTYLFVRSAHNSVENKILKIIIRPPIVGVPDFFIICDKGPSSRIGWPCFWNNLSLEIKFSPNKRININEVITEIPVLKVMYLKTLKTLTSEVKDLKKK
jgi:hypothetical protein